MNVQVMLLPSELLSTAGEVSGGGRVSSLSEQAVAVFDVLRATTTMTSALSAGVREIRIYPNVTAVRQAAESAEPSRLLCGEERCLPPAGFDLGNSPGAFRSEFHANRTVYMSTTNGTRAIIAARSAAVSVAAALVNASAVAKLLHQTGRPVTLLCSGTGGAVSMEDVIGCGAVIHALRRVAGESVRMINDSARIADRLFATHRDRLPEILSDGEGGRNVIAAGLAEDIAFASRLDVFDAVGVVHWTPDQSGELANPVVRLA